MCWTGWESRRKTLRAIWVATRRSSVVLPRTASDRASHTPGRGRRDPISSWSTATRGPRSVITVRRLWKVTNPFNAYTWRGTESRMELLTQLCHSLSISRFQFKKSRIWIIATQYGSRVKIHKYFESFLDIIRWNAKWWRLFVDFKGNFRGFLGFN